MNVRIGESATGDAMLSRTREQNNSVVSIGRTWLRTCNRAVNKTPARWPETAGEGRNSPD